jgi:hypothetical protein
MAEKTSALLVEFNLKFLVVKQVALPLSPIIGGHAVRNLAHPITGPVFLTFLMIIDPSSVRWRMRTLSSLRVKGHSLTWWQNARSIKHAISRHVSHARASALLIDSPHS